MKSFLFKSCRLIALLLLLISLLSNSEISQADENNLPPEQVRQLMTKTFDVMQDNYIEPNVVPELRALFLNKLELGQYDSLTSLEDFAHVLGQDLRAVTGDSHLSLYTVNPDEEITHILAHEEGKLTNNYGFEEVRYLSGNIGYLKFNKFSPDKQARDAVDASFNFLEQSDGIIIDLRDTVGGSPDLVQYMLSYFLPDETPLWYVLNSKSEKTAEISASNTAAHHSFRGDFPVWILTSRNTASASEIFAGVLQANSKAVLVGDTTASAGFYVGVRRITDTLAFRISLFKPIITATERNWERTGIIPDVDVPAMDALEHAGKLSDKAMRANL